MKAVATALAVMLGTTACGESKADSPAPPTISVTSPAFVHGATIPDRFTCIGGDDSPPLRWSNVPSGARQLVLRVTDVDAPDPPFVHWMVLGIDPRSRGVDAGAIPPDGDQVKNDLDRREWVGPCPPHGERHRYVFTLTASRSPIPTLRDAFADDAVLAEGTLTATFERR